MTATLLLNSTYEPLKVLSWQRAVTLVYQGKAHVIDEHEVVVRSPSKTWAIPAVIRLLEYVKLRRRPVVQFSRPNVFARDDHRCQYCGSQFHPLRLTLDHVVPVSHGGRKSWDNIVTSCEPCNKTKADRTPEQAGMPLLFGQPRRPAVLAPTTKLSAGVRTPHTWRKWLFA